MIDLYTFASANGYRASILLEETGLPYAVHAIDLKAGEQQAAPYLAINPLGLIPAIVDHDTGGAPICVGETLAIALYLVEKSGRLGPVTAAGRAQAWQWAAAGISGFGPPLFGVFLARQMDPVGHAPLIARYLDKVLQNFAALDTTLARQRFVAGDDYTYADVMLAPYALMSAPMHGIDLTGLPHVCRWRDEVGARPAVIKGMAVPHAR
jgi:GST-like protein